MNTPRSDENPEYKGKYLGFDVYIDESLSSKAWELRAVPKYSTTPQATDKGCCEPDDVILTSMPPQYRCKRCRNTWRQGEVRPTCHQSPTPSLSEGEDYIMPSIEKDGHQWIRLVDHEHLLSQTLSNERQRMVAEIGSYLMKYPEAILADYYADLLPPSPTED